MDTSLPDPLDTTLRTRLGDGWRTAGDLRACGQDSSKRRAPPAAVALPP